MGLIRLIILGLVIWMLWRLVKSFKARQEKQDKTGGEIGHQNMVSCKLCSVHVPEKDAIRYEQTWFCSEGHKAKYLENQQ